MSTVSLFIKSSLNFRDEVTLAVPRWKILQTDFQVFCVAVTKGLEWSQFTQAAKRKVTNR